MAKSTPREGLDMRPGAESLERPPPPPVLHENIPFLSPTALSYSALYIGMFTIHTLMVRQSQKNGGYVYDIFAVVFLGEVIKLALSVLFYIWYSPRWWDEIMAYRSVGKLYIVPGFLYALYNVLLYVNLLFFDPGVQRVLMSFKVVLSGIMFQVVFHRKLSRKKWVGLLFLTLACVLARAVDFKFEKADMISTLMIFIACFCSVLAGIMNEFLFKSDSGAHFVVQNIYLYLFCASCNLAFAFLLRPKLLLTFRWFDGITPFVWLMVLMGGLAGFTTSFVLKYLTILHKEFATGVETLVIALLSALFFGTGLPWTLLLAIGCIFLGFRAYNS